MIRAALLAAAATTLLGAPALANVQTVQFQCDIGGMPATLTAQVETYGATGMVGNTGATGPSIHVIGGQGTNVYYQGTLQSQTANYSFTGEGAYADFTDMGSYARFRVQFDLLPNGGLVLTANPFGPQPAQYACQPAGGGYQQQGYGYGGYGYGY